MQHRERAVWRGAGCEGSQTQICNLPPCDRPCRESKEHMAQPCDVLSGDACLVKCEKGFVPVNAAAICSDGAFLSPVACRPAGCTNPPAIANADVAACAGTAEGGECRVRCEPGFESATPSVTGDRLRVP